MTCFCGSVEHLLVLPVDITWLSHWSICLLLVSGRIFKMNFEFRYVRRAGGFSQCISFRWKRWWLVKCQFSDTSVFIVVTLLFFWLVAVHNAKVLLVTCVVLLLLPSSGRWRLDESVTWDSLSENLNQSLMWKNQKVCFPLSLPFCKHLQNCSFPYCSQDKQGSWLFPDLF